jgi:hypothetical protein
MLNQPTSSPMMTSMLGLPPRLAVVCRAGACVCPCATSTDVPVAMTDAAASVVPPRRTRRRSSAAPLSEFTWSFRMVLAPYSHHTPKAYVTRGCIDRLGVPSSRTVPAAVIWGAQVRAALQNFPRYFNLKDRSFRARDHQPDYVRRNMRDADHARASTTTNRSSIPTRCLSCRGGRSRLAGML